ncbi:MAG: ABC-F family ATP-binding cassette domain-containing protein [Planctomycetota bacterium]|nr:ABC-F family ATP-binding cassette domain-containing protein [Planctomycetota bacterium]MDA1106108.1 ABC-F family ATP-binding cassette domain-containing protein [Planctomycetota bacterium]
MPVLTTNALQFGHGTHIVLESVTCSIDPAERVGLVGRNGCGKSTLLKLICGKLQPDTGSVVLQRGTRVGYLEQEPLLDPHDTLRGSAARAFGRLGELAAEMEQLFEQMAHPELTTDELDSLLKRHAKLEEEFDRAGGHATDHKVDAVLHGLGFVDGQFHILVSSLSGGQKARLGLARLLLESPDVLLLDEPTNHLDIVGRRWLEDFLADDFKGAVILVSHDRWLLDRVVHRIIEVFDGSLREYPGNYADFVTLREERLMSQQRVHDKQQDRIRAEESYIRRYKAGQRAKQARGRATRLERYKQSDLVERPIELQALRIDLPRAPRLGDVAFDAEQVTKAYGDRMLFRPFDLRVKPGERIGIVGPNGAGKTTLVKVLLGEIDADAGIVKAAPRLVTGWFRQSHDHLDPLLTPWEYLQRAVPARGNGLKLNEQEARNLAGAFLFSGSDQDKAVGNLSGGERTRLVIAGLVASAKNLLVLDEPTNHLDISSAERLEAALSLPPDEGGYDGTLLLITHDRALLDATCDRLIVLDGEGGVIDFDGSWTEWEAREKEMVVQAREASARAAEDEARKKAAEAKRAQEKAKAQSTAPQPKRRGPHVRLSDTDVEKQLGAATKRNGEVEALLADPEVFKDRARSAALLNEHAGLAKKIPELEEEWLSRMG